MNYLLFTLKITARLLYIQDSFFSQSHSIHEALIDSCSKSVTGYGAYAFASSTGVKILLDDLEFQKMLERGSYSLVVGVDEITNMKCLEELIRIKTDFPSLDVRAFCHNDGGSLFHPKACLFEDPEGMGSLIMGSGNLTLGGLRKNREFFSKVELSEVELLRMKNYWLAWLAESENKLKPLDNEEVIRKAESNVYVRRAKTPREESKIPVKPETYSESENTENEINDGWTYGLNNQILFAEIPRSGDRWKQANFNVETFTDFFGATLGDNSQRILLRSVDETRQISPIEIRPSVSVKSQNYRFELDAASGLLYPSEGRPLGIFIKITTRMFLYCLIMPSNRLLHAEINEWMESNWQGRSDRMKRIVTNVSSVESLITKSVLKPYLSDS